MLVSIKKTLKKFFSKYNTEISVLQFNSHYRLYLLCKRKYKF